MAKQSKIDQIKSFIHKLDHSYKYKTRNERQNIVDELCEIAGIEPFTMQKQIDTGSIVKYQAGFYRVRKATRNTVNLGSIFGNTLYHKSISRTQVEEAYQEWHDIWVQSETYKSM